MEKWKTRLKKALREEPITTEHEKREVELQQKVKVLKMLKERKQR